MNRLLLDRISSTSLFCTTAQISDYDARWLNTKLSSDDIQVTARKKPKGGVRVTYSPVNPSLERVHDRIREFLAKHAYSAPESVHGYIKGRGPLSNARVHLGSAAILSVDIRDFFHSISSDMAEDSLAEVGLSAPVATGIVQACTYSHFLPTGFSSSPILSNIAFINYDNDLLKIANSFQVEYTRYVDDLSFSGKNVGDHLLDTLQEYFDSKPFSINDGKTKFQRRGRQQIVTGYTVANNEKPRLPKARRAKIRAWLHYAENKGIEAQAKHLGITDQEFVNRMEGLIAYLIASDRSIGMSYRARWKDVLSNEGL